MNVHSKGLLITFLGVMFVVPDALFIRLLDSSAWTISFWRGILASIFILGFLYFFQERDAFFKIFRTSYLVLVYIILFGLCAPGFVLAVKLTSVANVVLIIASMPVFAAIWSKIFLGEVISSRIKHTILGVFLGLIFIAYGSGFNENASLLGDGIALCVSAMFAGAVTIGRRLKTISLVPALPFAYLLGSLLVFPFSDTYTFLAAKWFIIVPHAASIALASALLALGPRYISPAEVAILILLESILSPLLVWLVLGENPGNWAILGGLIVIGVLVMSNLSFIRSQRRKNPN